MASAALKKMPTISSQDGEIPENMVQIVMDDYSFNPNLKRDMGKWDGDFVTCGLDYNLVSILGPQSGGKSTLLNLLFDTDFPVMGVEKRKQTTKGLWLAYDSKKKVLIMDVEGTDSKERGDKHINFERKSALFSLALSEVLIINMWSTDVGRYTASNYGTLKIVFELNLKLFYKEGMPKMLLLFILRDHSPKFSTSLDSLAETLRQDMHDIWDGIQKPEVLKGRTIDEFFDFQFISLANFIHEEAQFTDQVHELGRRFQDRQRPDAIFQSKYSRRIPADGLTEYGSRIWDTILAERDLDLPSVQEMLAQVRCEEIATAQLSELKKTLEPIKIKLERGAAVESLGKLLAEETEKAMGRYDAMASLYAQAVYMNRRELLTNQLEEVTQPLKHLMAQNVLARSTREMEDSVTLKLGKIMALGQPDMWSQVAIVCSATLDSVDSELINLSQDLAVAPEHGESWLVKGRQAANEMVRRKLKEETSETAIRLKLTERFKENFLYFDEDGVRLPKEFTPSTNLQEEYKEALRKTLPLVELYAAFEFPAHGDEPGETIELLSSAEVEMHKKRLEETYVADVYRQAKLDQRGHVSLSSLPLWVFAVVFVLGLNESVWLVRFLLNPANLLLVFTIMFISGSIYVLHQLGALGAAEAVFVATCRELLSQLNQGLGSFVANLNRAGADGAQPIADKKHD